MKKRLSDGERISLAINMRDSAELDWALAHAETKLDQAADDSLRRYWSEVRKRIIAAKVSLQD